MKTTKLLLTAALMSTMAAQPAFSADKKSEKKPGRTEESRPNKPNRPSRPNRPNNPGRTEEKRPRPRPGRPDVIVVERDKHHHHYNNGYYRGGYHNGYYYDNGYSGQASCSPEVKQKNVQAVEARLGVVMNSAEFKNASVLRSTVSDIKASKNLENKINAYLDLVGVDYSQPRDVVEFIGSRGEDRDQYIERAQTRLKLSESQADTLVSEISSTLLNGINR